MIIADSPTIIYALLDPRDRTIRYIGKTVSEPLRRWKSHLWQPSHTYKWFWICALKLRGLKPVWQTLEVVPISEDWEARERAWIARGHAEGWPLTNLTDGGDGWPVGYKHTAESREKMSRVQSGRKVSAEARANLSKATSGVLHWNFGRHHSEETKRKMSIAHKGKLLSDEHRAAMSEAAKHRPPISEETRAKLCAIVKHGSENRNSRLTEQQVLEIRKQYTEDHFAQRALAKKFGVCQRTVACIVNRITWTHI